MLIYILTYLYTYLHIYILTYLHIYIPEPGPRPAGHGHVAPGEAELAPPGVGVHAGGEAREGRGVPHPHHTVQHAPNLLGGAAAEALQDMLHLVWN